MIENPNEKFQKSQFDGGLPRYKSALNGLAKIRIFENDWAAYLRPFVRQLRDRLREILQR